MRLTPKFALLFALVGLVPLLLLGGLAFWQSQRALIANAEGHVLSVSVLKEDELLQWMDGNLTILESVAARPLVIELIESLVTTQRGTAEWTALREDLLTNHLMPNLTSRGLLDYHILHPETGQVLVATERKNEGKFRESEDFFVEGRLQTYIGRVEYHVAAERLVMHAATPIATGDGTLAAVLSAHVNLEEMGRILQLSSGMHETEDTYAINDFSFFVTEPLFGEGYALRRTLQTYGANAALRGEAGVTTYDDYRGRPVIGAYRWIEALNIGLLVEVDAQEVTAPVAALRRSMIILGAVVALLVVISSTGLARSLVRPIRRLLAGTQSLGSGALDVRIPVRGRGELADLTASFNEMAQNLQAVTASRDDLDREMRAREAAEKSLRIQQENIIKILDGIPHVIYVTDPETYEVLFVNKYFREVLGDDPVGGICYEKFQGLTEPCSFCTNDIIQETGEPHTWEYHNPMLDRHFLITDRIISWSDRPQARLELAMDVTEAKSAERALRRAKEITDSVIESLPGVFYHISPEGRFLRWNNTFTDVTGYTDDEMSKMPPTDLFQGGDKERVAAEIARVFEEGQSSVTADLVGKDGSRTAYYFTGLRMVIDGEPSLIGVGTDISEISRIEAQLRQSLNEVERSNKELEQFAYVASHDLQEPLRMVASYTQLLERRYKDKLDDDAKDFIHYAVDGANRMQRLINDLLAYSRVQTKGKPFDRLDLNSVLGNARRNLGSAIDEAQAVVTNDELPLVSGDEAQLVSLFQNLIGNAVKYRGEEAPRVHVGVEEQSGQWEFSVRDNGIGIHPDFHDRIFVIFQRLHGRDEYSGTGIGLSLCKRIVERHGGRMWVESVQGEGATFHFTLPKHLEGGEEHDSDG